MAEMCSCTICINLHAQLDRPTRRSSEVRGGSKVPENHIATSCQHEKRISDLQHPPQPTFQPRMSKTSSTILALAMLSAGYLSALCSTPPNPPPSHEKRHKTDRISPLTGIVATICRRTAVTIITYHVLLTLIPSYVPHHMTTFCPRPENLNSTLFTWNSTTTLALGLIFIGAAIRLSAYGGLGPNFTFQLSAPDHLVTTGVYRHMQHPSYTGQMLLCVGCAVLFLRWDASPACWVPGSILARLDGWGDIVSMGLLVFAGTMLGVRVGDEERMLKEKFGKKWEEWHRVTKRFIPGLV